MGAVSSIVDSVSNVVSGAFQGAGDILQGDVGKGLGELGPAALTAATMYATGGLGGGLESALADTGLATLGESVLPAAEAFGAGGGTLAADAAMAAGASGLGSLGGASLADLASQIGDQIGDFPTSGSYGNPTAPGVADAAKQLLGANAAAAGGGGMTLAEMIKATQAGGQLLGGLGKVASGIIGAKGTGIKPTAADPFANFRPGYADQLNALMLNPDLVTKLPGYQFNLRQGLDAMSAKQAQQGRLASGGALLEANAYGQNYAQNALKDYIGTLAQFSGATQAPGIGATAAANIGAANLGSTMGGINAVSQGVGQISNPIATLYSMYNSGSPTIG